MTDPVVSVLIPAHNGAGLIGETLATLSAQTFSDWEAIVVDDGSHDATRDIVAAWPDPRVRLLCNAANAGPVVTRNRAFAQARGRYVAALDQDDLCHPERFARQVAWLDAHPATALLGSQAQFLTDGAITPSNYAARTTPALIAWLTWIENPLVWSSVMLRRDAAAAALAPFTRPEMVYAEDFDLYHRIQAQGGIARLDEALIVYRHHAGGISKRFVTTMRANAARVLAEAHATVPDLDAPRAAQLLVQHNMGGEPVPDRATLQDLAHAIAWLQAVFLARTTPTAADVALIRHETALRWRRMLRIALRSGSLSVVDVAAVRTGWADPTALAPAALIGALRRARRRMGR